MTQLNPGLLAAAAATTLSCTAPVLDDETPATADVAADNIERPFETRLRDLADRTKPDARRWTISERMTEHGVPGMAVAFIENGRIAEVRGYGSLSADEADPVTGDTVFSMGSVSKVVNAALILRLAQDGHLDLDRDINDYLVRWKVPATSHTVGHPVTLRQVLSHTAGFSQHGFPDFQPGEPLPTALETLNGTGPAKHGRVVVQFTPGEKMDYSGGGITVSQVLVEDVTGLPYAEAARRYVFEPLGMTRSTFVNPLSESHGNIAKAHDRQGRPRALPRGYEAMPEMAASGLWSSAADMAKFVTALLGDDEFLGSALRADMLTRVQASWHGLGPRLNGSGSKRVFHHGGSNNSYQSWIEGHPESGGGIVVLTNGAGGRMLAYEVRLAIEEAREWTVNFPDDFDAPDFVEDQ